LSIESPEAYILASQMNNELNRKQIVAIEPSNCEQLQKLGFFNRNESDYRRLAGSVVESVISRGLVMRMRFTGGKNLLLAPEYGGRILYHPANSEIPKKFHLRIEFSDKSALTVTLTALGVVQAFDDDNLNESYVYRRDFSSTPSPINGKEFVFDTFKNALSRKNVNIKAAIVGKEALVVGLSNSAFQDIVFRAGIHPKRKCSNLSEEEMKSLFTAIKTLITDRIKSGGKSQFVDFYGKQGTYNPLMGQNMKGQVCPKCGVSIEALSLGGGQVFFCPKCQT
jgi:formamidopyrimidine-DNA glycosylase